MQKCGELCEQLGMDYKTAQHVVAFAMELYQRGIISKETTDGLELEWGNEDAVIELLNKIARREGFGNILADGSTIAAKKIGKGAEKYDFSVGGMPDFLEARSVSKPTWPRYDRAYTLGVLTCYRGGDNVKTTHRSLQYHRVPGVDILDPRWALGKAYDAEQSKIVQRYVEGLDMPEDVKKRVYGTPPYVDPLAYEGKASLMMFVEDMNTLYNILGYCNGRVVGPTALAKVLSPCIGVEVTPDELLRLGHRIFALNWAFNAREGVTLNSLAFPERFYTEPIPGGPAKGGILSRQKIKETMAEYCQLKGWDRKTGLPTRRTLEELDLKDVADELENLGMSGAAAELE